MQNRRKQITNSVIIAYKHTILYLVYIIDIMRQNKDIQTKQLNEF